MDPKVRAIGLHLGTATAAMVATAMWMASHSVDLYAIMDQLNVVIKEIAKLVATVGTFAGGAYQVWKATQKNTVIDAAAIPGTTVITSPTIAAATPQLNVVSNSETKVIEKVTEKVVP